MFYFRSRDYHFGRNGGIYSVDSERGGLVEKYKHIAIAAVVVIALVYIVSQTNWYQNYANGTGGS
jgi:hypothetical protein